jgi:hypothetical protein
VASSKTSKKILKCRLFEATSNLNNEERMMLVLRWLLTFAVIVIAAFFTAVAARASGLFNLVTYNWSELRDSFPPATQHQNVRHEGLHDCRVQLSPQQVLWCITRYGRLGLRGVVAALLLTGVVGWLTVP